MQFAFGKVMATKEDQGKVRHPLEVEMGSMRKERRSLFHEPSHLGRATAPEQRKRATGITPGDVMGDS